MRCVVIAAIPVVALAAIWGYYFNVDVPPDMAEPWIYRGFVGGNLMMFHAGYLYSLFTGEDPFYMHTKIQIGLMNLVKQRVPEDVQETLGVINGVNVRVLQPRDVNNENKPAIIFYHGGGFYTGSVYMYEGLMFRFVRDTGCVVFMVDYRLSWENPAPGPVEECHRATEGIFRDAKKLGIDSQKVVLSGDSAGGALAAAVALRLRDAESAFKPAAQVLIYPWLQALDFHLPAYHQNNQYFVTRRDLALSTALFANVSYDFIAQMDNNAHVPLKAREKYSDLISHSFLPKDVVGESYKPHRSKFTDQTYSKQLEECVTNPYNFPLMHDDLADLPPALIFTEEFDALRDDGLIYAKRLESFGGNVTVINDRAGFHGVFCFMADPINSKHGNAMTDKITEYIKNVI